MSQAIPGGRPRASSDGDILDEGLCGSLLDRSSGFSDIGLGDVVLGPGRHSEDRPRSRSSSRVNRAKTQVGSGNSPTSTIITGEKSTPSEDSLRDKAEDDCDSEGISSRSTGSVSKVRKGAGRSRLSFKSMKKAVSRAFVKDNHNHVKNSKTTSIKDPTADSNLKSSDQTLDTHTGKIWTPELRRIGKSYSDMNGNGGHKKSTSRPLVMEPDIEMTIPKWKNVPGTIGIFNHGNSCFINTILQCLSNTDSFTEYFVKEFFKNDLKQNRNNKKSVFRSTHGEVTEQLAYLFKSLWCGNYHSDISKEFKAFVGKYNDQYRGDHQHDAQEFLLWLLDRLHEDLCTPPKKKPKSQKSLNNKSEEELSLEALSANGESFVLKLFQAMHSSTLTCPSCGDRSSTFDPYLCVSLPLPQSCPRVIYVIIVSLEDYANEVKYAFTLNQFDCVKELRESISSETGFPANQFILCQLKDNGFGATYSNEQPLSDIAENETIYAIETFSDDEDVVTGDSEFDSPKAQVLVLQMEMTEESYRSIRFCGPSLLKVNRDITWRELQRDILYSLDEAFYPDIVPQKLVPLFSLKVWDGSSSGKLLSRDIEMPLYTQAAERAFNTLSEDFGPNHIKILALWDSQAKERVIQDDAEHVKINQSVRNINTNPPSHVSLDECFRLYTQEEKLNGEDAWLCPHCKQQQQGTIKSLGLWSLPDVLVLHLKRFKQTSMRRSKLDTLVDFPVDNLNMSPHLVNNARTRADLKSDDYTYDLIGVSNHFGNMMGGHYTAFCRSPVDGKWREFNDTKVTVLDGPVATKEAYILYYQRRSLTKDVNQKLFTGDHWVFSLPLSSTNMIQEPVKGGLSSVDESSTPHTRRTRSRSSSPMTHRRANGISQPSSPVHSPTHRQSRPLQRQASSSEQMVRRGKSANTLPSTNHLSQSNAANDDELSSINTSRDKKGQDAYSSISYRKPLPLVIKHNNKDSDASFSEGKDKENALQSVSSSYSNGCHSIASASVKALKDIKPTSQHDNEILSDAKYPPSHLSSTIGRENRSVNNSSHLGFPYESAGALRVNLENIDVPVSSRSTSGLYARRKLAELKRENSYETQNGHSSIPSAKSSTKNTISNRFQTQTSYDIAKSNPINLDKETIIVKDSSSESNKQRNKDVTNTFSSDIYHRDIFLGYRKDSYTCPTLPEESENYVLYRDENRGKTHLMESSLPSRINQEHFRDLAHKHFGEPKYPDHLERSLDYSPSHNRQPEMYTKFATIARSREITPSSRTSKDLAYHMPRSSTDQNIRYSDLPPSLVAPPSPTPPHSYREERNIGARISASGLPISNISFLHAYDRPSLHLDDQSSLASSRLTPLYSTGRFHRPRGVWGIRPKPAKVEKGFPNPYLRESSV